MIEYLIIIAAAIIGGCGIVITKNMYGNSTIHGKLKKRYDEYIYDLEKENKKLKGKMNQLKQGLQISADSADNPISAIGEIIAQFAPMLPKSVRPFLSDPKLMKYAEKMLSENPEQIKEILTKFVKPSKDGKKDAISDDEGFSV